MDVSQSFLDGCLGSVLAEVVTVLALYRTSRTGKLPIRYRRVGFWLARASLVISAGFLSVAFHPDQPLKAVFVGASALLLVRRMGAGDEGGDESANEEASSITAATSPKKGSRKRPPSKGAASLPQVTPETIEDPTRKDQDEFVVVSVIEDGNR